jgi:hypothetical protein
VAQKNVNISEKIGDRLPSEQECELWGKKSLPRLRNASEDLSNWALNYLMGLNGSQTVREGVLFCLFFQWKC